MDHDFTSKNYQIIPKILSKENKFIYIQSNIREIYPLFLYEQRSSST